MRRTIPFVAIAFLVAACANATDPINDFPDSGGIDTGTDVAAKDSGKEASTPSDGGKDHQVADTGSDTGDNDTGADATVDASVDASDGGSVVDASDGGSVVDGGTGNDTCGQAVALMNGVSASGDTTAAADDYQVEVNISSVCDNNSSLGGYTYDGNDVAYTITVPNGKKLTITVNPTTQWDPAVAIVESCASAGPTCLGGADEGFDGDPETADYTNTTGADKVVFVIVDSYSTSSDGPFTIQATLQ
jgi:hypothetical protein